MNTPNTFWFHCGRCGSLFQSHAGTAKDRRCTACGENPGLDMLEPPVESVSPRDESPPPPAAKPERIGHRTKRSGHKLSNQQIMWLLGGGWLLILGLIVTCASWLWHESAPVQSQPDATVTDATAAANEDRVFFSHAVPKCAEAFSAFLTAGTPEARNQFVLTPISTAGRMARFYSLNPWLNITPGAFSLSGSSILNLPGEKTIETQWKSQDGKILDAVFREDHGEWRLDWDHFVRYSDYPWSLFLAGSGPSEGEFRLLARQRMAKERKDAEMISLVLYAPRIGWPSEVGFQSPGFLVSRKGRDGQLLDAAFTLAKHGTGLFGATLPNINPEDMIRVRVKVRRFEVDLERKFEITEVVACHWFSVDDPGVKPAAPTEATAPDR